VKRRIETILALAVVAAAISAAGTAGAATAKKVATARTLTFYTIATAAQFVNNADDRLRGKGANPFGNFHDSTPTTKQAKGPFPGDEAIYSFAVYAHADHTHRIGSGTFVCLYNFQKNAYCDVTYQLPTGRVVGGGAFDFTATTFPLAITGGTGAYRNKAGTMEVATISKYVQRLTINLG
jgi:allene oxide cyclase-like protein